MCLHDSRLSSRTIGSCLKSNINETFRTDLGVSISLNAISKPQTASLAKKDDVREWKRFVNNALLTRKHNTFIFDLFLCRIVYPFPRY